MNTQIQIRKYTNTQIQHMTKCQKYLTYAIFFNSWWFKDVKNDNPKCSDPRSESRLIRSGTQEYRYTVEDRLLHCPHRFIQAFCPLEIGNYFFEWMAGVLDGGRGQWDKYILNSRQIHSKI